MGLLDRFRRNKAGVPARYWISPAEMEGLEQLNWLTDPRGVDALYLPELRGAPLPQGFGLPVIPTPGPSTRFDMLDMANSLEWALRANPRRENCSHFYFLRELHFSSLIGSADEERGARRDDTSGTVVDRGRLRNCPLCGCTTTPFCFLEDDEILFFYDLKCRTRADHNSRQDNFFYLNPFTRRVYHGGVGDLRFAVYCRTCKKGFHAIIDRLCCPDRAELSSVVAHDDVDYVRHDRRLAVEETVVWLRAGCVVQAQVAARESAGSTGPSAASLSVIANCKEIRGLFEGALATYEQAVRMVPDDRQAKLNLAGCCLAYGGMDALTERVQAGLVDKESMQEALEADRRSRDAGGAAANERGASEGNTPDRLMHFLAARCVAENLAKKERYSDALDLLRPDLAAVCSDDTYLEFTTKDPELTCWNVKFALMLARRVGDFDLCIELASRFVRLGGRWEKTESFIEESSRLLRWQKNQTSESDRRMEEQEFRESMQRAARAYDARDYEGALAAASACTDLWPTSCYGWVETGNALHELRRLGDAAASYERVITLNPACVEGYTEFAALILKEHHDVATLNRALVLLQRAEHLDQDNKRVRELLADLDKRIRSHYEIFKDECLRVDKQRDRAADEQASVTRVAEAT